MSDEEQKQPEQVETGEPEVRLSQPSVDQITPEEYLRRARRGEVDIDPRGRVRVARPSGKTEGGVNLRKRRAWFSR